MGPCPGAVGPRPGDRPARPTPPPPRHQQGLHRPFGGTHVAGSSGGDDGTIGAGGHRLRGRSLTDGPTCAPGRRLRRPKVLDAVLPAAQPWRAGVSGAPPPAERAAVRRHRGDLSQCTLASWSGPAPMSAAPPWHLQRKRQPFAPARNCAAGSTVHPPSRARPPGATRAGRLPTSTSTISSSCWPAVSDAASPQTVSSGSCDCTTQAPHRRPRQTSRRRPRCHGRTSQTPPAAQCRSGPPADGAPRGRPLAARPYAPLAHRRRARPVAAAAPVGQSCAALVGEVGVEPTRRSRGTGS